MHEGDDDEALNVILTQRFVLQLLIEHNANVNALNKYGESPLHRAAYFGHLACVKVIMGMFFVGMLNRTVLTIIHEKIDAHPRWCNH